MGSCGALSLAVPLNAAVPRLWVGTWFGVCALLHQVSSGLEVVVKAVCVAS